MAGKRITYIDLLKGLGISLVVLGHMTPGIGPESYQRFREIIYTFHMPLFMAVSGYLYAATARIGSLKDYRVFISKKLKRLVVPYFVVSLAILLVKVIAGRFVTLENPVSADFLRCIFLYPGQGIASFLWFMYALFVIFLMFPLIELMFRNKVFLFILFSAAALIRAPGLFGLEAVFLLTIYFYLGVLLCRYYERIQQRALFLAGAALVFIVVVSVQGLPKPWYSLAAGLSGTLCCWFLAPYLVRFKRLAQVLSFIGVFSSPIYLFHTASMAPVKILFHDLLRSGAFIFYLSLSVIFCAGIIVPILIARFIFNKNRRLSLLFLGVERTSA